MTAPSASERPSWSARREPGPLVLAGAALALATLQPLSNQDTFGHLAQGRTIAALGGPPALDPYSFWRETPQPWVNYEWLSDWLTWDAFALGGPDAVILLSALLVAVGGALVVALGGRLGGRGAAWLTAVLVILAIPASRPRLSARPHLVAMVLAGAYLLLLTRPAARSGVRTAAPTLGALFVLHVAWLNLHGSHLLGAGIVLSAALASVLDRPAWPARAAACGVVALASCVSPYGPEIVVDALRHVLDDRYRDAITEWHSMFEIGDRFTIVYTCVGLGASVLALAGAIRGGPERALLGIVGTALGVLALRSGRFSLEMLVLGAPLVAVELASYARTSPWVERLASTRALVPTSLVAGAFALGFSWMTTSDLPIGLGVDGHALPDDASAFVEEHLPGARVLGSMPTSWYLLFRAPSARVLVDGRMPFYGPEHVAIVEAAMDTDGALLRVVRRYGVDTVMVQHTAPPDAAAGRGASSSPLFVRAWIDGMFAVYVLRTAPHAAEIDPTRFDALPGTYEPSAILGAPPERLDAIREDVAHLAPTEGGQAFAHFVRAMLRVRPLARDHGWAGYRAPASDTERDALALARRELDGTIRWTGPVPVLLAQRTLLALAACDLEAASRALDEAREDEESRETLFGAAELALRRGDEGAVRSFLRQAAAMPGADGDTWIAALGAELDEHLRCE